VVRQKTLSFPLVLALAAGGASGCSEDYLTVCRCGTELTPSDLSCSDRGTCEGNFELVGHSDLNARGMNSALAIAGDHAYVGSRTDGGTHSGTGILIVDIADPTSPEVVGEFGPPDVALVGMSTRELRTVPDKNLLISLNLPCSPSLTDCSWDPEYIDTGGVAETANFKLFDISEPRAPVLVGTYDFGVHPDSIDVAEPHEFFLWRDPENRDRILLYVSRLVGPPILQVIDVTNPAEPRSLDGWDAINDGNLIDPLSEIEGEFRKYQAAHSVSVSDDGRIAYVSHYGAGFYMVDTSAIAAGVEGGEMDILTPLDGRVDYSPPAAPRTHSAVPVPGRPYVLLTDEVLSVEGDIGCPWGWARMVDVEDPRAPTLILDYDAEDDRVFAVGQMQIAENDPDLCPPVELQAQTTYTAHNPTVTRNLALITWYSGGLQVFDTSNAAAPRQVGAFFPEPIPSVDIEDPQQGYVPIGMWSYPIIRDGLIYVTDIRNGLYVLRYTGPLQEEVSDVVFREGCSNLDGAAPEPPAEG